MIAHLNIFFVHVIYFCAIEHIFLTFIISPVASHSRLWLMQVFHYQFVLHYFDICGSFSNNTESTYSHPPTTFHQMLSSVYFPYTLQLASLQVGEINYICFALKCILNGLWYWVFIFLVKSISFLSQNFVGASSFEHNHLLSHHQLAETLSTTLKLNGWWKMFSYQCYTSGCILRVHLQYIEAFSLQSFPYLCLRFPACSAAWGGNWLQPVLRQSIMRVTIEENIWEMMGHFLSNWWEVAPREIQFIPRVTGGATGMWRRVWWQWL